MIPAGIFRIHTNFESSVPFRSVPKALGAVVTTNFEINLAAGLISHGVRSSALVIKTVKSKILNQNIR